MSIIHLKISEDLASKLGVKTASEVEKLLEAKSTPQTAESVDKPTPATEAPQVPAETVKTAEQVAPAVIAAEAGSVKAEVAEPKAEVTIRTLQAEIESLKANQQTAIAKAVADAFATLGSPAPLKIASEKPASSTRNQLLAEMDEIKDARERSRFIDAHRKELFGE